MDFDVAYVVFAAFDTPPVLSIPCAIVGPVNHRLFVGFLEHGFSHGTSVSCCTDDIGSEVGSLLAVSAANTHHDAFCMALFTGTFSGVIAAVAVVVQHVANIASLDDGTASVSNQLLDLIEQKVVKLLAR